MLVAVAKDSRFKRVWVSDHGNAPTIAPWANEVVLAQRLAQHIHANLLDRNRGSTYCRLYSKRQWLEAWSRFVNRFDPASAQRKLISPPVAKVHNPM